MVDGPTLRSDDSERKQSPDARGFAKFAQSPAGERQFLPIGLGGKKQSAL
jgi:hypothetical protein